VLADALIFAGSGAAVVAAGIFLARAGDAIAGATRLGGLWIGSVLVAAATSLPEIATDVVAVRVGAVDLAAGDLFGSSMANMLILAIIDLLPPRTQVLRRVALDHALSAALAISLTALAAIFATARIQVSILGLGPGSLVLVAIFVAGTRAVYRQAARSDAPAAGAQAAPEGAGGSLRPQVAVFVAAAAVIFVAAPFFARAAKALALASGLGTTFFGTLVVGLSTSLPELVSSVAAVRIGAYDLAVGNLFGSNAFNMVIFAALDLAHGPGPIFAAIDPLHAATGLFGVLLMSLGLAAIVYRAERRFALLEPDSALMIFAYVLAMWFLRARTGGG
jgi:cation:H+ antiporter